MKKALAFILCCMLLLSSACALAAQEYTVAEKLYKQLWAGSGFSGELTVQSGAQDAMKANVDYIYVRAENEAPAQHRLDIALADAQLHVQLLEDTLNFQADAIGPDWYSLALSEEVGALMGSVLSHTGAPGLAQLLSQGAVAVHNSTALQNALEPYLVRMDVWLEEYRQDAVLEKLDENTTIMQVHYVLSPAAVKAQVKQLIVDVLSDHIVLPLLKNALGEEAAALYLNPDWQSWYFAAVDALPFPGDLTLSRTISLEGDVLETHLSLPLYDAQAGVVTLSFDRVRSQADLPDENAIRLESEQRTISLTYQEYSSMTGVNVMSGTFETREANQETGFAARFTLKQQVESAQDEAGNEKQTCSWALTVEPVQEGAFDPVEAQLTACFESPQLKSAATNVNAELTVQSGETDLHMAFTGASRKKWDPQPVPAPIPFAADWLKQLNP